MPEQMFDGFAHARYREEVEERWGRDAYARSDSWWRNTSADGKEAFGKELEALNGGWAGAASRGLRPTSTEAQALAQRHLAWLSAVPGVPRKEDGSLSAEYVRGLGDLYVTDPRFTSNYGGQAGAELVRASLDAWLSRHP